MVFMGVELGELGMGLLELRSDIQFVSINLSVNL